MVEGAADDVRDYHEINWKNIKQKVMFFSSQMKTIKNEKKI